MEQQNKNWFRRHYILTTIGAIFVLSVIGGSVGSNNTPKTEAENRVSTSAVKESIKVTATKLSDDYKANEVAADAKYKGNLVEISGVIGTIGKDITDTPYVTLSIGQYDITSVQCMFGKADETALSTLNRGQTITLQGEVSGKLGNILIRGCKIVR